MGTLGGQALMFEYEPTLPGGLESEILSQPRQIDPPSMMI